MTYCHVSAQSDDHARQLSDEQAMEEAAERHMDAIRADYGPRRMQELAEALSAHISEDELNGCLALYRDQNPSAPPQPLSETTISPKHRLTIMDLFTHRAGYIARVVANLKSTNNSDLAGVWEEDYQALHATYRDLFGAEAADRMQRYYVERVYHGDS